MTAVQAIFLTPALSTSVVVVTYTFLTVLTTTCKIAFSRYFSQPVFIGPKDKPCFLSDVLLKSFNTFLSPAYIFHLINYINNCNRGIIVGTVTEQPRNHCSISDRSKKCSFTCSFTRHTLKRADRLCYSHIILFNGYWTLFILVSRVRCVKLTNHIRLVSSLVMKEAVTPLTRIPSS